VSGPPPQLFVGVVPHWLFAAAFRDRDCVEALRCIRDIRSVLLASPERAAAVPARAAEGARASTNARRPAAIVPFSFVRVKKVLAWDLRANRAELCRGDART